MFDNGDIGVPIKWNIDNKETVMNPSIPVIFNFQRPVYEVSGEPCWSHQACHPGVWRNQILLTGWVTPDLFQTQ